jgi:hypothetical protein
MFETSARRVARSGAAFGFCTTAVRLAPWLLCALLSSSEALARPIAPELVCRTYPNIPDCSGSLVTCSHCHSSVYPTSWNAFGASVKSKLAPGDAFEAALPDALAGLEQEDADGDGLSNLEELELGTAPGDAASGWSAAPAPEGAGNPQYDVGNYDYAFAYRRVMILYCGASPTYDQRQAFDADRPDAETLRGRLHDALSECLDSKHWSETALPRLADKRVRPLAAAGPDSMIRIGPRRLVVGDYRYDYRLWRYLLTGDRDMRELLTARYHVEENEQGELEQVSGARPKEDPMAFAGGQPLEEEHRAGMLTTQWYLAINTMFSSLPRTSAAQAYRSYLGADISSGEGIRPVAGEPVDIDDKGVADDRCATCHSTLDPLAYAFAKYEGIDSMFGGGFGGYRPDRVTRMPRWSDEAQTPVLFGQQVGSLPEWAQVAAESDMFKRNMAELFFEHALTRKPGPPDQREFKLMWQALPEDGYSANRLIHRLVDTQAFGVP